MDEFDTAAARCGVTIEESSKLDLKATLEWRREEWVRVDDRCSVMLDNGTLVVSCLDSEEHPVDDYGYNEAILAKCGLVVKFTGEGDGEGDQFVGQYVETFPEGHWYWQ